MARSSRAADNAIVKRAVRKAKGKAGATIRSAPAPSPNPMTNLILADVALRGGGRLLRHAVERTVLGAKYSPDKAKNIIKGRSMAQTLISTALARIATRSLPGALIVGGGMLAKTLYDRSRDSRAAKADGEQAIAEQAKDGKEA